MMERFITMPCMCSQDGNPFFKRIYNLYIITCFKKENLFQQLNLNIFNALLWNINKKKIGWSLEVLLQ